MAARPQFVDSPQQSSWQGVNVHARNYRSTTRVSPPTTQYMPNRFIPNALGNSFDGLNHINALGQEPHVHHQGLPPPMGQSMTNRFFPNALGNSFDGLNHMDAPVQGPRVHHQAGPGKMEEPLYEPIDLMMGEDGKLTCCVKQCRSRFTYDHMATHVHGHYEDISTREVIVKGEVVAKKVCPIPGCTEEPMLWKNLLWHLQSQAHYNLLSTACLQCNSVFARPDHLIRHMRDIHHAAPAKKRTVRG